MKSNTELKFLLVLLGCSNYRSPLTHKNFASFKGKAKLCFDLANRGWLDYTREIASVKILPAGKALLKLDANQLPIDTVALKVLEEIAQATGKIKATTLKKVKPADRQLVLQGLGDRGLVEVEIQPAAKQAEVWLTSVGLEYLREDYHPAGKLPAISLDLLHNYLQFLRKPQSIKAASVAVPVAVADSFTELSDTEVLQTIVALDQELGTENYLPLFQLRQHLPLSRDFLDQVLYRLQRHDRIELGTLQEVSAYQPEQIDAGIPQDIGGPLFFVSVIE
jgi:hypothetical protein